MNRPFLSDVLLLDASFSAVPIHKALRAAGHRVWTMGNRSRDALALAFPELWIEGDYGNLISVQSEMHMRGIDLVVPGCTDVAMTTFAALGGTLHYPCSAETQASLNSKDQFRALCTELDLPCPEVILPNALPSEGLFICKPAIGFSGRGISIFDASCPSDIQKALAMARASSPTGQIVCEAFVEGPLYSFSVFLVNGIIFRSFVVREGSRYDRFSVDTSYVVPLDEWPETAPLTCAIEKLSKRLQFCNGLVHVQFIAGKFGPQIIEITRRCPGDLYAKLIEDSTGFPYASWYALSFTMSHFPPAISDESIADNLRADEISLFCKSVLRMTLKEEVGTSFQGLVIPQLNADTEVIPLRMPGEDITGAGYERTAVVFQRFSSHERCLAAFDFFLSKKRQ
ncbi:hypothetical protein [Acetobacter sp.]|uniref:hypothetical protein n=1 Tax=Acetobacter sp. TaxID=440 RepID=UPI0039EBFB8F